MDAIRCTRQKIRKATQSHDRLTFFKFQVWNGQQNSPARLTQADPLHETQRAKGNPETHWQTLWEPQGCLNSMFSARRPSGRITSGSHFRFVSTAVPTLRKPSENQGGLADDKQKSKSTFCSLKSPLKPAFPMTQFMSPKGLIFLHHNTFQV